MAKKCLNMKLTFNKKDALFKPGEERKIPEFMKPFLCQTCYGGGMFGLTHKDTKDTIQGLCVACAGKGYVVEERDLLAILALTSNQLALFCKEVILPAMHPGETKQAMGHQIIENLRLSSVALFHLREQGMQMEPVEENAPKISLVKS